MFTCLHDQRRFLNCEFLLFMQCLFPMVNRMMCLGNISSNTVYFKNQSFLELGLFLWYNQRLACLFFSKGAVSCARCGIISSWCNQRLACLFLRLLVVLTLAAHILEKKDCFSAKSGGCLIHLLLFPPSPSWSPCFLLRNC